MSFDLNIGRVCNHKIYRELVLLEDDQRTLQLSKPLSSGVDIQVFAADNQVPKSMYSVVYDIDPRSLNQTRMILLLAKWKSPQDMFEISYLTVKQYCPKCMGLEVLDDLGYDVRGQISTLRNESLLLQNLEKWTITQIRSNIFHSFVGTGLISLIGQRVADPDFIAAKITQEITTALQKFQDLQGQYMLTGRPMTDGETLQSLDNVVVVIDEDDPTIMKADVTVTARSGKTVEFTQYLRVRG